MSSRGMRQFLDRYLDLCFMEVRGKRSKTLVRGGVSSVLRIWTCHLWTTCLRPRHAFLYLLKAVMTADWRTPRPKSANGERELCGWYIEKLFFVQLTIYTVANGQWQRRPAIPEQGHEYLCVHDEWPTKSLDLLNVCRSLCAASRKAILQQGTGSSAF